MFSWAVVRRACETSAGLLHKRTPHVKVMKFIDGFGNENFESVAWKSMAGKGPRSRHWWKSTLGCRVLVEVGITNIPKERDRHGEWRRANHLPAGPNKTLSDGSN